ncbi:pentapeptide repeat-containing protein [Streptomyces griseorubiginosus]|uniref:pentapeptide repeat-containing protein n=1 Tax=Streptomyces griseorubiginosus TaxID=67304 RepID=UPI000D15014B
MPPGRSRPSRPTGRGFRRASFRKSSFRKASFRTASFRKASFRTASFRRSSTPVPCGPAPPICCAVGAGCVWEPWRRSRCWWWGRCSRTRPRTPRPGAPPCRRRPRAPCCGPPTSPAPRPTSGTTPHVSTSPPGRPAAPASGTRTSSGGP